MNTRKRQEEIKTREIDTQESKNREVEDVNITKKKQQQFALNGHISHALLSPPHLLLPSHKLVLCGLNHM